MLGAKGRRHEGREVVLQGLQDAWASPVGEAGERVSDGSKGRAGFLTLVSED